MLELIFIEGTKRGETLRLNFSKLWLGRQPSCDLVLDGDGISPVHCSIERRGESYFLADNKSEFGSFLNRVRIVEAPLHAGDLISLGEHEIQVRQAGARLRFRFQIEAQDGGTQLLDQADLIIGRKSSCQIQLDALEVNPEHARISYENGQVRIIDLSDGAGVYVNGHRIVDQKLDNGDQIVIKPFELQLSIQEDRCIVRIQQATAEDDARPSQGIFAPAKWAQDKAPVWVPSSDLKAGKFPLIWTLAALGAVVVLSVLAWQMKPLWYSPGPLASSHSQVACASCHVSAGDQREAGCQNCHSKVQTALTTAARAHLAKGVDCASCHPEHRESADLVRTTGSSCQEAGCHVEIHKKEREMLAGQRRPWPGSGVPVGAAFDARFASFTGKAEDPLHRKHKEMFGQNCTVCHTDQAGKVKVTPEVMRSRCLTCHYAAILKAPIPGGSPLEARFHNFKTHPDDPMHVRHASALSRECGSCHTDGNPSIPVQREEMRARCLSCHGFGEESTINQRCYRCHFQHVESDPEKLRQLLIPQPVLTQNKQSRLDGIWLVLGSLIFVPLVYLAYLLLSTRIVRGRSLATTASPAKNHKPKAVEAKPVVPNPTVASSQKRPSINLDLCLGCGLCVQACPFDVLEIVNEKAIAARMVDCTGYAACVAECPTDAIQLLSAGPLQSQKLPVFDANMRSNVPGLYLAGEVTGKALIKFAINQGKLVADTISANPPRPDNPIDVLVVGSGPAGISAALAAMQAGFKVKVLEQGTISNTIRNYPRQKFVMAEPVSIPLFGPLWIDDTSKETLLDSWQKIITSTGLVIDEGIKVVGVERNQQGFQVKSETGTYQAGSVVLAIGRRGSPRRLGVPGEALSKVSYSLLDADAYRGKAISVVGGGDSGIETAIALSRADLQNRVSLIVRGTGFHRANPRNLKKVLKRIEEGIIQVHEESEVISIEEGRIILQRAGNREELENDFVFILAGGEGPLELLAASGVEIQNQLLG